MDQQQQTREQSTCTEVQVSKSEWLFAYMFKIKLWSIVTLQFVYFTAYRGTRATSVPKCLHAPNYLKNPWFLQS